MTRLAEWAMLSYGWRRFLMLLAAGAAAALSIPPLFILPAMFVVVGGPAAMGVGAVLDAMSGG